MVLPTLSSCYHDHNLVWNSWIKMNKSTSPGIWKGLIMIPSAFIFWTKSCVWSDFNVSFAHRWFYCIEELFGLVVLEITLAFCWILYQYYVLSIRVFLRAINTYAETMNQKFLNNDDFEVQVTFLQMSSSTIYSVILFICLTFFYHFITLLVME